ncbi:MAG: hypothetical protein PWP65_1360 [Clostridia bacterium]|nr:hypothetical protein [Clostridia bacterium]
MARFYLGTSGYNYSHWRGKFYPEDLSTKDWITYYATRFNTVELNVTFYRLPLAKTFTTWYERTPDGFLFALKGSRLITHYKRLVGVEEALQSFFTRAAGLKEKLGVVLWQLPPGLHADTERLLAFCELLNSHPLARVARHAFEFRHQSWFVPEIYDILARYSYALCVADAPRWPQAKEVTADFVYLRFHGSRKLYSSSYTSEELAGWAAQVKTWLAQGRDVYAYFNNDAEGWAVTNACELERLVSFNKDL